MSIKKTMILGILGLCMISAIILSIIIVFINNSNTKKLNSDFRDYDLNAEKKHLVNYLDMAYSTIEKNYAAATTKDGLISEYGTELEKIIEVAENIAQTQYKEAYNGKITMEEAQKNALESIRAIRFGNNKEYVFITDRSKPNPKMLLNPTVPALEGKYLSGDQFNVEVGTNRNINEVFEELCAKDGEAYVHYLWAKTQDDGSSKEEPKLSYAKLFDEWDWIIGTGVYVDDAIKNAKKKSMEEIKKMRYDGGVGYFWINDKSKPYPKMIMHPTSPELNGKVLDNAKYNVVGDENQNLFQEFVNICNESGNGYVDYIWPKPTKNGLTEDQPKLSYVKEFKSWNWIIGTGVYTDDIEAAVEKQENTMAKNNAKFILYILLTIGIIISFAIVMVYRFLSNRIVNPIKEIINYLTEMAKGNLKLNFRPSTKKDIFEFTLIKKHLQNTVSALSSVITKINEEAVSVYQSSNETKQYIEDLQTNLDNISITTEELSACMEETAAATEEMNVLTEEIETSTSSMFSNVNQKRDQLRENTVDFKDSADKLVDSLQHMVKGISEVSTSNNQNAVGTTEISKSVTDILKQAQNVNKQSDKLKKTAFQLMESVGIFNI
ncbi:MAG: methyl-accepting chemotaxis protein [Clostridiales bacterium]